MNFISLFLQAAAPAQGGGTFQLVFFVLIIGVFYFFMIRPQMKRQKELKKYREALKKGDKVVTTGGIYGKVAEVKEAYVTVEIAKDITIKVDKSAIVIDMTDANTKR